MSVGKIAVFVHLINLLGIKVEIGQHPEKRL
jgi:hypothetical protein